MSRKSTPLGTLLHALGNAADRGTDLVQLSLDAAAFGDLIESLEFKIKELTKALHNKESFTHELQNEIARLKGKLEQYETYEDLQQEEGGFYDQPYVADSEQRLLAESAKNRRQLESYQKVAIKFNDVFGKRDREFRLQFLSTTIGRTIKTSKELKAHEISMVLGRLEEYRLEQNQTLQSARKTMGEHFDGGRI